MDMSGRMQCGMAPPWRKNDASVPGRYRHVQNDWCQTPSFSAMFSLDTLGVYLEYFPAWGSHIARVCLEAKLLKIIPYVDNVSEHFSRTTFDYGGIFSKYSKGVMNGRGYPRTRPCSRSLWAFQDLNRERQISAGTAGPQPRTPDLSGHCRTSARRQRECQIECQKEFQNTCQKVWQNGCQIECQSICQKECQIERQKKCLAETMSE